MQPASNCVVVPCADAAQQGTMSFMDVGADAAEFHEYVDSPYVDFEREYEYPSAYKMVSTAASVLVVTGTIAYLFSGQAALPIVGQFVVGSMLLAIVACCVFTCGNASFYRTTAASTSSSAFQPLSRREFRHVIGTTRCSVGTWLYVLSGLLVSILMDVLYPNVAESGVFYTFGFLCVVLTSVLYIGGAWLASRKIMSTSTPIKCGFVVSMMWGGGIFSIATAGLVNTLEIIFLWPGMFPACNIGADMGMIRSGIIQDPGVGCTRIKWLQWIITAGLNEEVLKFLVLARLRTSVEGIAKSCLLTRCLRGSAHGVPCCAWFFKLATSPMAVVLAGMASGAGFAALENISYVLKVQGMYISHRAAYGIDGSRVTEWIASIRLFSASIHICMTGTCAVALSYEMFVAPSAWFLKYMAVFTMAVLHGSFNASTGWSKDPFFTLPVYMKGWPLSGHEVTYTDCIGLFLNLQFLVWWFVARFYIEPEYQRNRQRRLLLEEGGRAEVELPQGSPESFDVRAA